MNHHVLEIGLALALIAIAALLSARLRFSIAPFLILAGVAVGPHVGPFDLRFVETSPFIEFIGRIGVLFL